MSLHYHRQLSKSLSYFKNNETRDLATLWTKAADRNKAVNFDEAVIHNSNHRESRFVGYPTRSFELP